MRILTEIEEAGGLRAILSSGQGPGAQLGRGGAGVLVIRSAGLFVVFCNQLLLARLLGVDAYGEYVYVISWISVLAVASLLGLNTATVRYVSEYRASADWGLLSGFRRRSLQLTTACSVLILGIGFVLLWLLGDRFSPTLQHAFLVGLLLVPLTTGLELRSATIAGLHRVVVARLLPDVVRPAAFAVALLAAWWFVGEQLNAPWALGANVAATGAVMVLAGTVAGRALGKRGAEGPYYRSREWLRTAWPLFLTAIFSVVLTRSDVVMLGALRSPSEAGVYAVAARVADLVAFGLAAVGTASGPLYAQYWSQRDLSRVRRTARISALLASLVAISICAAVVTVGRPLLGAFGTEFRSGYLPLVILCAGQVGNAITGTVGALLTMSGNERQVARILGLAAVLNLGLNALVVPPFGATGAACVTATMVVLRNGALALVAIRVLDVDTTLASLWKRA